MVGFPILDQLLMKRMLPDRSDYPGLGDVVVKPTHAHYCPFHTGSHFAANCRIYILARAGENTATSTELAAEAFHSGEHSVEMGDGWHGCGHWQLPFPHLGTR